MPTSDAVNPTASAAQAGQEALKRIEKVQSARKTALDLSGLGLRNMPAELWQLTGLKELLLFNNRLRDVPVELGRLKELEVLSLSNNQLTKVPVELGQLAALKRLRLSSNRLMSVPVELGQLRELKELYLYENRLTSVPVELGALEKLEKLYLSNNQLTSVPAELGLLTGLKELYLYENRLTSVPAELGALEELEKLYLSDNRLTSVPGELGQLMRLKELWLFKNQLTSVPVELGSLEDLENLYLSNNQLTSVPVELGRLKRLKELNLSNNQLTSVPVELGGLTGLKYLYLFGNQLTSVPVELEGLKALEKLHLSNNRLTNVPVELGRLTGLKELNLAHNQLTSIPVELGWLTGLEELYLSHNRLMTVPVELGQLTGLKQLYLFGNQLTSVPVELGRLKALEKLHLSNNRLTSVPAELGQLMELKELNLFDNELTSIPVELGQLNELEKLSFSTNQLTSVPVELGRLMGLKELYLSDNRLTSVPVELGRLTRLKELYLSDNQLTSVPVELEQLRELQKLDLSQNQLISVPVELGRIDALEYISCAKNLFLRFPSQDVVGLGSISTAKYLKAVAKNSLQIWESKMLIVGEGQAGKTWLYEALNGRLSGGRRKDDKGTVGIEIGPLELPHPQRKLEMMRLSVWDFAGQEINHATHQFFFSNRTLFLLVWSARAGTAAGKVEKWLKNIRDRAPEARVILVATQWDSPHNDYPKEGLKREFPQVVATLEVSSQTGEGIDTLRELVRHQAAELPMMGLHWPKDWWAVAQELKLLRPSAPQITMADLRQRLERHSLVNEEFGLLIRWLHELGEVLHFSEPPELAERIVLDPQWTTRHVGQVLASSRVADNKGLVTKECLGEVWGEYEEGVRNFLLALMEAFDLAYRIPEDRDDRSLVVERLAEDPVDYSDKWEPFAHKPELRLRLHLASLHPGIPTWFIARCHRFTQERHWRRGVLFGDERQKPHHLGLVVANEYERTVDFTVRGPMPFTFMPLLLDGFFATIDRRYPGLKIEKKVPCPGKHRDGKTCTHEFNLEELEGLIAPPHQDDDKILEHRCIQCRTKHRVQDLLCGVGFAPLSGEITLARLGELVTDEATKTRDHMDARLAALQQWWQLEHVRQWNLIQQIEEQSCPSVLALYALDSGSLIMASKLRVQLYCMHPSCWHSVGANGRCDFAPVREGIAKAGAFLGKWAGWLKPAATIVGAAVPIVGGSVGLAAEATKNLKEELELTAKTLEQLDKLPEGQAIDGSLKINDSRAAMQVGREALAGLKEFLDSLNFPVKPYGGLKRVLTREEHVLWLCPEHATTFGR